MTKRFDLYGSQSLSLADAARGLEAAIGLLVEPHESSYRGGAYYRGAGDAVEELIIQTNFEDEDGYLSEPDFPSYRTLVYVTEPNDVITDQIHELADLSLLRTEVL